MAKIQLRNCKIYLRDGTTPTPNKLEIKIGEGEISWTEARPLEYTNDRGKIDARNLGDEVPLEVSLSAKWEYYRGDGLGNPSPVDVLKFKNDAANWVSTDPDGCQPKCIDLIIENVPDCAGAGKMETYVFPKFFAENIEFNISPSSSDMSFSGTCLAIEPTTVREDITTAA